MSFGSDKCGLMAVKRGELILNNGVDLPSEHIACMKVKYKFFDNSRPHGNCDEEAMKTATSKYNQRI